jgi:hypothetical protein
VDDARGEDVVMDEFIVRADRVIDVAFGGRHHVFSLKWEERACSFLVMEDLSTYDFGDLTALVVACHDECVRASIRCGGPKRLRITLSNRERKHRSPDSCAHPTLDQHIEQIRRGGNYQPLFNQLRIEETNVP